MTFYLILPILIVTLQSATVSSTYTIVTDLSGRDLEVLECPSTYLYAHAGLMLIAIGSNSAIKLRSAVKLRSADAGRDAHTNCDDDV